MFAGARFAFRGTPSIDASLTRTSRATAVEEKVGRSGPLVFVEVTHEISADGHALVVETQDIVYRAAAAEKSTEPRRQPEADHDGDWQWDHELGTDPTLLFRFSALTYNAHRIHYDRRYAIEVEGYPGLVVHGPLQAVGLADLCRRALPDRRLEAFEFRALRPAFDGTSLLLRGRMVDENRVDLAAFDRDGQATMRARASLHEV
jgi:3-methylfumaryl-CoA hydratase